MHNLAQLACNIVINEYNFAILSDFFANKNTYVYNKKYTNKLFGTVS